MKWIKVIVKALLSVFLLFCIGSCSIGYVLEESSFGKYLDKKEKAENGLSSAQSYYEREEFGSLKDILDLYKCYDSSFDKYWEVVNGYTDYQEVLQYKRAKDDEGKNIYIQKVKDNAKNCRFKENQKFLDDWAKKVEGK